MNSFQRHIDQNTSAKSTPRGRRWQGIFTAALALLTLLFAAGCAVTAVDPVLPKRQITMLCIDHNPDAGENYDRDIGLLLDSMGINHRMTGGAFPGECPHRLQTKIAWSNSLIPFVSAMELVVTEDNRPLGDASYQVGRDRFGSAASKAKPLLEELLAEYDKSGNNSSKKSNRDRPTRDD